MSFQLKISGSNTLIIQFSGTVTKEEITAVRENAIAMINSNDLNRIFCDIRKGDLNINQVDLFNFAASRKEVYRVIRRTAILYAENSNIKEDVRLYCKGASKRGVKIKAFSDLNKSKTWLNS